MLLPLAVLGLLGAGFGAYAFGRAPQPASSSLPPAPAQAPPAQTTEQEPEPETAGAIPPAAWAGQVDALCAALSTETVPRPRKAAEVDALLAQGVDVGGRFAIDFAALGWPEGEKEAAFALRTSWAKNVELVSEARAAFRAREFQKLLRLAEQQTTLARTRNREFGRLGAPRCAVEQPTSSGPDASVADALAAYPLTAAEVVRWVLFERRAVVVAFYARDAALDAAAIRDARAAAGDAGAGFLAVDVEREGQAAALALGYEVIEAPTVLVLGRGPALRARFDGYADREKVAQAVENALA